MNTLAIQLPVGLDFEKGLMSRTPVFRKPSSSRLTMVRSCATGPSSGQNLLAVPGLPKKKDSLRRAYKLQFQIAPDKRRLAKSAHGAKEQIALRGRWHALGAVLSNL